MNTKLRLHLPIILSIFSSVGVISTAFISAKDSQNKSKRNISNEGKNKIEITKNFCKAYWRTMITASLTIAATVSSTIISKKNEMSLIATAGMLSAGWKKYENKVKTVIGKAKNDEILKSIAEDDAKNELKNTPIEDGKKLYWELHAGFFKAYEKDVLLAVNQLNERISCGTVDGLCCSQPFLVTIKDFLLDAKAELLDRNDFDIDDLKFGWDLDYLMDMYGSSWVYVSFIDSNKITDIKNESLKKRNGYTIIEFHEEPIYNPERYTDYISKNISSEEYFDGKKEDFIKKGFLNDEEILYR